MEIEKKIEFDTAETETTNIKTRSIRADEKVLERFSQLSKDYFGSQNECLAQLVTTWELHNASNELPDMKADINDVEAHLQALQSAFVHLLDLSANADKRIGDCYQKTIADNQCKLDEAKNALSEVRATAEAVQTELTDTQDKLVAAEAEKDRLEMELDDKRKTIEELRERLPEAKAREKLIADLQASKDEAEKRAEKAERVCESLKISLEQEKENAKSALDNARANAETEKNNAVSAEKLEFAETINQYLERIDNLMTEKDRLKDEISQLQRQIDSYKKINPSETIAE